MKKIEKCTTCNINLIEKGSVGFPCPNCGDYIGRCNSCRTLGNVYCCKTCGFVGP